MSIHISSDLVLADVADGLSLDHPVIGWHNVVTAATIVADEEDDNHPASELANPATHLYWQGTSTAAQEITITTNEVDGIDYVGLAGHNFGTAEIALSLGYYDGVTWVELVEEFMPADDGPLLLRFVLQSRATVVISLASGSAIPRAATAYCGKLLVIERQIYAGHVALPDGLKTSFVNGMSETGNFMGRIELGAWNESVIPLSLLSPAWFRSNMRPFLQRTDRAPFFFGWRPQTYPREIGYCWLIEDPVPAPVAPSNLIALEMKVRGLV